MLGDEALVLFVNKTLIVEDWCSWFLSFDLLLSELWVSWFINEEIWELSVEDEEDFEEWWWYDSLWLEISLEKLMFEENKQGTLADLAVYFESKAVKGEIVIVVAGAE